MFHDIRLKYLRPFDSPPNNHTFVRLMSCDEPEIIRSLSLFIFHAFKEDIIICMVILLNSYKKDDHCISRTVIIILLLNVLKGPLAYQIKTTTTTTIQMLCVFCVFCI